MSNDEVRLTLTEEIDRMLAERAAARTRIEREQREYDSYRVCWLSPNCTKVVNSQWQTREYVEVYAGVAARNPETIVWLEGASWEVL